MFLGLVKDRFSVPAMIVEGAGRGGGQGRRAAPPRSGSALRAAPPGARMVIAGHDASEIRCGNVLRLAFSPVSCAVIVSLTDDQVDKFKIISRGRCH